MILEYYEAIDKHKYVDFLRVGSAAFSLRKDGMGGKFKWEDVNYTDRKGNTLPFHNINTLYTSPVGLEMLKMKYPELKEYL